ncbi:MAG: chitosanase [Desulfovibrio sp.]|nr:chitosanase [Desulfovibrio sp.]
MAHSPIKLENSGSRPLNSSARRSSSPAKGSSFARVMEDTSASAAKNDAVSANASRATSKKGMPRVARLPESRGIPLQNQNPVLAGRTPSDMLRMQNFQKAQGDIVRTRTMGELMDSMGTSNLSTLDIARNANMARTVGNIAAAAGNGRGFALTAADYIHTAPVSLKRGRKMQRNRNYSPEGIGKLSAKFESGGDGIAAVGYDRTGGTSYGKYQIASAVGSMAGFLSFLDEQAPDLSRRLRKAGPSNTGSRRGAMPDEWRAIAAEQPQRFERLQEAYIRESHYDPAVKAITQRTGLEENTLSAAMREVIWSTAVQHGPAGAARIFERADGLSGKPTDADYERNLIRNVYNVRARQFGSSTAQVQNAVRNRFHEERELALGMLKNQSRSNRA